ncbi:HotDog domain-containing protein [Terfezia claveryi]|nr:HotDog domain-containing protein [Terfezia claveryi]
MSTIGNTLIPKLTVAESATAFKPEHEHQIEVEEYITNHPLVKSLRANPAFSESRPHLRFSDAHRSTSLTAGVLSGPGRIVVPPIVFVDEEAKTMVMVCYLGDLVCGYPGFVHGGLLATLLDEGLGRCTFTALPNKVGMTANLNINYRAPTKAGQYIVMKAQVTKAEGRKAWADGRLETLPRAEGEKPVVLVEGSGLFVEPRQVKLVSLVTGPITA